MSCLSFNVILLFALPLASEGLVGRLLVSAVTEFGTAIESNYQKMLPPTVYAPINVNPMGTGCGRRVRI